MLTPNLFSLKPYSQEKHSKDPRESDTQHPDDGDDTEAEHGVYDLSA